MRIVANCLSAVAVVMIWAPSTALSAEAQDHEIERAISEITKGLVGCAPVDVVEADRVDPDDFLHRQRLKLSLRTVADQGHRPRPLGGKITGGHCRGRGGAERGQQGHLGQEHGIARRNFGK